MFLVDFILHIDQYIYTLANATGNWTYLILLAIIFIETGGIIFPFLPGDSLLFAAGALAANPHMHFNVLTFMMLFIIGALSGDTTNFLIARTWGYHLIQQPLLKRFIKENYLADARTYFSEKGRFAIILGRYVPIIRTFIPFVAGLSHVSPKTFMKQAIIAALSWSLIATGSGYLFGNIPFVKSHFSVIILAIVAISLLPSILSSLKYKKSTQNV
ncbi:VTT domain-containing protein [Streptococcus hyovaginalis]|nr:VTT domain-containing protein [Streptococcus hyovaginalis]